MQRLKEYLRKGKGREALAGSAGGRPQGCTVHSRVLPPACLCALSPAQGCGGPHAAGLGRAGGRSTRTAGPRSVPCSHPQLCVRARRPAPPTAQASRRQQPIQGGLRQNTGCAQGVPLHDAQPGAAGQVGPGWAAPPRSLHPSSPTCSPLWSCRRRGWEATGVRGALAGAGPCAPVCVEPSRRAVLRRATWLGLAIHASSWANRVYARRGVR